MKIVTIIVIALAMSLCVNAQDYKNWVQQAPRLDSAYFHTTEARRVADNVMSFQLKTGAWPKNINFFHEHSTATPNDDEGTIDNDATTTEVRFLMRMYNATGDEHYREASQKGVEYLLAMQYENGGWPQYWPRHDHYHGHITYNDNAMVNVMQLVRQVRDSQAPFLPATLPDSLRLRAANAFEKGVECILQTQVRQNGQPTVWCQQYDEHTLEPAGARAFELVGLCSSESVNIVRLLQSIPNPDSRIEAAIEGALRWFDSNKITGLRREEFTDSLGRKDYRMIADSTSSRQWARFYTIEDNRPFFVGRDGVMRFRVEGIDHERRNGYAWYGRQAEKILPATNNGSSSARGPL